MAAEYLAVNDTPHLVGDRRRSSSRRAGHLVDRRELEPIREFLADVGEREPRRAAHVGDCAGSALDRARPFSRLIIELHRRRGLGDEGAAADAGEFALEVTP